MPPQRWTLRAGCAAENARLSPAATPLCYVTAFTRKKVRPVPRIVIQLGDDQFEAELIQEDAPTTVASILDALPIESTTRQWGAEIYFEIPVELGPENPHAVVSKGDVGYWPAGNCLCLFYGKTPLSASEEEIVPASPVNLVGRLDGVEGLSSHGPEERVQVRPAD
ncbi:MAG: DUF3830 family protein [Planctomycetes bacterium]|nr:DUF3830 family protein [Planctomycetota bacterium]